MNTSNKTVAELAYELWESRGQPEGSAEGDWLEAERRLALPGTNSGSNAQIVDEAGMDSFPASDPPANHTPDEPASNADAKWAVNPKKQTARDPM